MTETTGKDAIAELDDLLDRERKALLVGDLDRLHRLTPEKEALLARMTGVDANDEDGLQSLQSKIGRNQDLIASAAAGIRAVADRIAAIRQVQSGLETYDRTGRKTRHPNAQPRDLERRA